MQCGQSVRLLNVKPVGASCTPVGFKRLLISRAQTRVEGSDAFRVQWDRPTSLNDCAVWKTLIGCKCKRYKLRSKTTTPRRKSKISHAREKKKLTNSPTQHNLYSGRTWGSAKTSMALTQNEIIRHYRGQTKGPKY